MKLVSIDDTHVHFQNVSIHTKTRYRQARKINISEQV